MEQPVNISVGRIGEDIATEYISQLGYRIIERNFRTPFGEIDIIALDPDGTLSFVEVKTIDAPRAIIPEDNLTKAKLSKLAKICSFYANSHPDKIRDELGWRIDLVAITINPEPCDHSIQQYGKINFAVSHYKNISV